MFGEIVELVIEVEEMEERRVGVIGEELPARLISQCFRLLKVLVQDPIQVLLESTSFIELLSSAVSIETESLVGHVAKEITNLLDSSRCWK